MTQAQLKTLGGLSLEGIRSSRLSPQLLLLLTYLKLEGKQARMQLASLFWPDAAHELTKKGERKDLRNLGSALATLRRELGFDPEDTRALEALACDASELKALFNTQTLKEALRLYQQGIFLEGLEHKPRLHLSSDLSEWLSETRRSFKRQAVEAMLHLAEEALKQGDAQTVASYAQQAYEQSSTQEPAFLSRLYKLLLFAGSPLSTKVRQAFETCLEDALDEGRLSEESIDLFLTLSQQANPSLAVAQVATNLSPKASILCLEELIREKLIGAKQEVLAPDIAEHYLDKRPSERLRILSQLREHSADTHALSIYRQIYKYTQSYGGAGYWHKAQNAYKEEAKKLIHEQNFQEAEALLGELKLAEDTAQKEPQAALRFLHAYTLERLRQPEKGLKVIAGIEETLDILAIKSALLLRAKNYKAAKEAAWFAYEQSASSDSSSWAKAIAANSLGQIAYFENDFSSAEFYYEQSASAWQLNHVTSRELGALMNHSIILAATGKTSQAKLFYESIIAKSTLFPLLQLRALVNLSHLHNLQESWSDAIANLSNALKIMQEQALTQADHLLHIEILNNFAYALWQSGDLRQAHYYFNEAMQLASESGEKLMYAAALGNMGALHNQLGKLETALSIFKELGNQHEYQEYLPLFAKTLETQLNNETQTELPKHIYTLLHKYHDDLKSVSPNFELESIQMKTP